MELGPILDVLDKKTILVTGATGFLAKIFVEKILRVQPNVKKLYLLVRATDAKSALQRFNTEVVATDLFKVLKEKYHTNLPNFLSEKVILVPGDITCENLGVKDSSLKEQMWRDVEVVVNAAASTNFNERYDVALAINTFGAKFVSDFGKKCINIKLLLHVSTAYVSRERSGVILETPCHLGEILDINYEKKVTEDKLKVLGSDHNANEESIKLAMKDLGMQRANHYGWSNTYVFTKALGEMTLQHSKGDTPLVILRPTIITSTYKEPFPGWVDNIKTIDSVIVGYGKGWLKFFPMDPESICDVIPADMVVNAMIATIMANVDRASSETIYHVGSSVSNPLKYTSFLKWAYQYFSQHPWTNKDQQHIVSEFIVLKSMSSFYRYITLRYLLPLQIFKLVNVILCQAFNGTCKNIERKVNRVLRTVKFYQPYVFSTSLYDDINTERLRNEVRVCKHENDIFYFDPRIIDWEDYFLHTHIPGLVRYECK